MRRLLFLFVGIGAFLSGFAQKNIQGYVSDAKTGEKLIGCIVHIAGTSEAVTCNNYGFFSIRINQFPVSLVFSYIGYVSDTLKADSFSENVNIFLKSRAIDLKEVEIKTEGEGVSTKKIGVLEIPIHQIRILPAIGGEVDVLKAFQLMPGVQAGNEGTSGLYVRGGTPDQNLMLLDDIPLYYVNHIGGFVSVFDINAINDVKLIKGGFPARYGGRLSSVVDVRMKSGNSDTLKGEFGIGIIASRIFIEGPVIDKKTRIMFSIRRCNADLVSRVATKLASSNEYSAGYTFYDIYNKITHDFNSKNSLSFAFYKGRDKVFLNQKDKLVAGSNSIYNYHGNLHWGNALLSLKWNHQYNHKLFGSLTLALTHFEYSNIIKYQQKDNTSLDIIEKASTSFVSGVKDIILKKDFDLYVDNNTSFKFGASYTSHQFNPGLNMYKNSTRDTSSGSPELTSLELIIYTEIEKTIKGKLSSNIGLHYNLYFTDHTAFHSLQPRLTLNYKLKQDLSVKASYVYMQQNLHLLSNNGTGLPTDLWVPATPDTKPQYSNLFSAGLFYRVKEKSLEINVEAYYKTFNHQIEFSEGASFFGGVNNWEEKIERDGKGLSYGIEFLIQKKQGQFSGWIGYTLSYNYRQFNTINNGQWYPYKFDRRHYLTFVANYNFRKNIILSSDFVFNTGNAITLPDGRYPTINYAYSNATINNPVPIFTQSFDNTYTYPGRNKSRMPVYHRMDISVRFMKERHKGTREWIVTVYNLYGRQNPYYLFIDADKHKKLHLYQLSLFSIIPSVSYIRSF